jgi:hypothetical protein
MSHLKISVVTFLCEEVTFLVIIINDYVHGLLFSIRIGLPIIVLVFPDKGVHTDDTGQLVEADTSLSFLSHISSFSVCFDYVFYYVEY